MAKTAQNGSKMPPRRRRWPQESSRKLAPRWSPGGSQDASKTVKMVQQSPRRSKQRPRGP
eukprot:1041897-Pyramimonas_sp.AAC.1